MTSINFKVSESLIYHICQQNMKYLNHVHKRTFKEFTDLYQWNKIPIHLNLPIHQ